MNDINHPALNNHSIFKVHNSKTESFLYSILAALYSDKIDRRSFHHPDAYIKYKKILNLKNISFPMKNRDINHFLKNNHKLDISIRLFDSIAVSETDMQIFEYKVFGRGRKTINILFHKSYKKKKSIYRYFWIKNINNIKKHPKKFFMCNLFR